MKHPAFTRADALPANVATFFPHSVSEAQKWEPVMLRRALASRVMVVAVPRVECTWRAYIDAVEGYNHDAEYEAVAANGATLPEALARVLFPIFGEVPYAS